ncbi:S-layer protein [Thermococcus sp.]|uniref:S-layer protein n=1 Tax=Thermococcus sp. TaxID=35749 RepID=UPI002630D7E5|nr:S-layer protein [Thermococcus sp.]
MKVKKIAALAVGAAMVGATIGFASATTVPNIPKSFFVNNDGTPNVKIVVGSNAAAMDVASAADIAVALGSLLYTTEQVEAQNAYVKVKEVIPPANAATWTIYAYNYTTITQDHGINNITSWATSYDELPDNYWWNGAAYTANYTQWEDSFSVPVTLKGKDSVGKYSVDWHININKVELKSIDPKPKNWTKAAPPKKADLVVPAGKLSIFVDYVLYNYSYTETEKQTLGEPEWGTKTVTKTVTKTAIGDKEEVNAMGGTINKVVLPGVGAGDDFTVFGQSYHVYEVGDGSFTVGYVDPKDPDWFKLHESRIIGDRWNVTVQDISLSQDTAIVLVTDTTNGQQVTALLNKDTPVYIYYDNSGQLVWGTSQVSEAGIMLDLKSTFVGIDNTIMASIYYVYDIEKYTSANFHPAAGWNATISTYQSSGVYYIANITLINNKELEGNPIDIFGAYNLMYKYVQKGYDEYYNPAADDFVKAPKNKKFIVAYAYICLKEKEGKVIEKELKVGDTLPDSDYTVEAIYADNIVIKPVTEPITVMDFEVDVNNPGSNLILVGGPVANSVTKYLVDEGKSKVDWYNSPGDVEYIPDAFGSYGAVIVAGATRNETRVAAEALMQYLAELAKE